MTIDQTAQVTPKPRRLRTTLDMLKWTSVEDSAAGLPIFSESSSILNITRDKRDIYSLQSPLTS